MGALAIFRASHGSRVCLPPCPHPLVGISAPRRYPPTFHARNTPYLARSRTRPSCYVVFLSACHDVPVSLVDFTCVDDRAAVWGARPAGGPRIETMCAFVVSRPRCPFCPRDTDADQNQFSTGPSRRSDGGPTAFKPTAPFPPAPPESALCGTPRLKHIPGSHS